MSLGKCLWKFHGNFVEISGNFMEISIFYLCNLRPFYGGGGMLLKLCIQKQYLGDDGPRMFSTWLEQPFDGIFGANSNIHMCQGRSTPIIAI